jgi:hypothetical protein
MSTASEQLRELAAFYTGRGDGESTLFEIWERGEARGDSVTPSTYCAEYRRWMRDKLVEVLDEHGAAGLLSLGSGNAAVESEVHGKGYRVLCVDVVQQAVDLARAKGLEAVRADVTRWAPAEPWPVIYMDGVLGHLYTAADGILPVLGRVRSWLTGPGSPAGGRGGSLVASNDSPRNGGPAQPAPGVAAFHWLSGAYLRDQALRAGFVSASVQTYVYERPLSGRRARSVLVARANN